MAASYTSALAEELAPDVLERFLRYVRIDTQSRRDRDVVAQHAGPARPRRVLVDELEDAGLDDVQLDENGYVIATLAGNGAAAAMATSSA